MNSGVTYQKSFSFAVAVIHFYQSLIKQKEFIISKQLLRCGTSIGANISEAQSAQSKKDFLHKMEIALKEARETEYWLTLIQKTQLVSVDCTPMLMLNVELIKLLVATIKTMKSALSVSCFSVQLSAH